MKTKLFLPVEPDGSIVLPAIFIEHLGIRTDELVAVNIPAQPSGCVDCDDLELSLTSCCDESQCSGYTTHDDVINLPQELLDIADIPAGTELTAIIEDGVIAFASEERTQDCGIMGELLADKDVLILPLSKLCEDNE